MTLSVDIFWSFRSPYSYLATGRYVEMAQQYDVTINVRVVAPIAIRDPEFFERVDPNMPPYVVKDSQRVAEMMGIPFRWPRPDPVVMDMRTRSIAAEQPYIHRLNALGVEAARQGRGLAFVDEVSRVIWNGQTDDWHLGTHLKTAAERAGLDFISLERAIEMDPESYLRELADNAIALQHSGHWGVPTAVFQNEPFFGQDRVDLLIWRLKQDGMRPRE